MAEPAARLAEGPISRVRRASEGPALGIQVVPAAGAESILPQWSNLAARTTGDNVFFHPDFAIPAMRHLAPDVSLGVVHGLDGRFAALAPFTASRLGRIAPAVRLWSHDYGPLGLPLVDRDTLTAAVSTLLDGLAPPASGVSFVAPDLPTDGAVAAALVDAARRRGRPVDVLDPHVRGALYRDDPTMIDPRRGLTAHRRKEYARLMRRLAEVGEVKLVASIAPAEVAERFEQFLELEAAGWKGQRGSALASSAATRDFARAAVLARAAAGHARIDSIDLGGKPIAMLVSFAAGATAWTWKIAYDETWGRFSPGVQLMLAVPSQIFSDATIRSIDSCASADHPMIDHIWSGRMAVGTLVIGPPGGSTAHRIGLAAARAEIAARAAIRRFI
jgi:CelD/BcsL family acetyltransferase involved in cellulose biosynthesis